MRWKFWQRPEQEFKPEPPKPFVLEGEHNLDPIDHDYGPGHRMWGHDYVVHELIEDGKFVRASIWGYGFARGQTIALSNSTNQDGRSVYRVMEARNMLDPEDMWSVLLQHDPRPRPRAGTVKKQVSGTGSLADDLIF